MLEHRLRVVEATGVGVLVKRRGGQSFMIAYSEVLTAERLRNWSGIRLHTRGFTTVRLRVRGQGLVDFEGLLREHGVRIVDCWGAMITPTLADFERALAEGPDPVRQSSDNA